MASNSEIDFQRLLDKCEELASKHEFENWRFAKYIVSLDTLLGKLNKLSVNKPTQDVLKDYAKKVEFLKELSTMNKSPNGKTKSSTQNLGPIQTPKDTRLKQVYHQVQINKEKQIKEELFSTKSRPDESNEKSGDMDIDKILIEQQKLQDRMAEEMIEVARHMKENSLIARGLIKNDNQKLTEVNSMADKNYTNLKTENERVQKHTQNCCNWSMWLMIALVFIVFMMMVLFMKLFPKSQTPVYSYFGDTTKTTVASSTITPTTTANSLKFEFLNKNNSYHDKSIL